MALPYLLNHQSFKIQNKTTGWQMTNTLQLPQQGEEGRGSRAEQQTAVSMVFLVIVSCRRAFCNGKASSVTSDSEIETVWRPDYTKPLDSLLTINTRIKI